MMTKHSNSSNDGLKHDEAFAPKVMVRFFNYLCEVSCDDIETTCAVYLMIVLQVP